MSNQQQFSVSISQTLQPASDPVCIVIKTPQTAYDIRLEDAPDLRDLKVKQVMESADIVSSGWFEVIEFTHNQDDDLICQLCDEQLSETAYQLVNNQSDWMVIGHGQCILHVQNELTSLMRANYEYFLSQFI